MTELDPTLDRRREPGGGGNWVDVFELDFFAADGSFGGFVTMGLYPTAGRGWYWACVTGNDRQLVLAVDEEMPIPKWPKLEVRTDGLWTDLIPQVPFDHFTVGLEAFGVGLDDVNEVFTGLRGDRTPMGFDLEWDTAGPVETLGFEASVSMACKAHGEILLGHEEFDFEGLGVRRHWWGSDERRFEPGMELSGWWDSGMPIPSQRCELLKRIDTETMVLVLDDERELTAKVQSVAPLPISGPTHDPAQRWRMLCRFGDDEVAGTGWLDLR